MIVRFGCNSTKCRCVSTVADLAGCIRCRGLELSCGRGFLMLDDTTAVLVVTTRTGGLTKMVGAYPVKFAETVVFRA